jgi:large subunit ribosomal protein L20
MARIKRGVTSHAKHKKLLNLAKGYRGGRSKNIQEAKSAVLHAGDYAFAGRKQKKRQFRRLWILQLGNAVRAEGMSYSKFMAALKAKNIMLDRKILAEIAVHSLVDFKKIVSSVK